MRSARSTSLATFMLIVCAHILSLATAASAAVRTWDGQQSTGMLSARDNWNNANNWDNNALPANADDVVFGTAFTSGTSIDLTANRTVNSFTINTATGFSIDGGDNLTLTSGNFTRNDVAGIEADHAINAAIILGANGQFAINGSGTLTINGVIQDGASAFSFTKSGAGVLVLSGGANTYNGDTTIDAGVLRLGVNDKIGDGAGFGTVVVNASGTFDLGGFSDTINGLSGTGTVDVSSGTSTLTLGGNNASATFSGVISDTGTLNLVKTGTGAQTLSGTNSYDGATTISAGTLIAANTSALGTTAGSTTVASGATLSFQGSINYSSNEVVSIAGNGVGGIGAINNASGTNTFAGAITLTANSSIGSAAETLTLTNVIAGGFDLTKVGAGTLTLSGANTYGGSTAISDGTLTLGASNVIPNGSAVSLANTAGANLNVNNQTETIASLSGGGAAGGNVQLGTGTLTTGDATNTTYAGVISGTGGGLVKQGSGSLELTNANTYTGGTTINDGTLLANNSSGSATGTGAVTVENGGTLAGNGAVTGAVTVNDGGTLAPGTSIGTLTTGSISFDPDGTLAIEIDLSMSPAADLLSVANSGTFSPAGATLALAISNAPLTLASPLTFLIVSNDGIDAISGTFASIVGLPSGYTASLNYAYAGTDVLGRLGSGNDLAVTLSIAAVPEATAFLFGGVACCILGAAHVRRQLRRRYAGE